MLARIMVMAFSTAALTACTPPEPAAEGALGYEGGMASFLAGDLLQITVEMSGPATADDLRAYTDCAAADAAVFQGFGFARHVRTTVKEKGGLRRADAVYTVSSALPAGARTIDAATQAETCRELGIPRV
ncbi:MAG: hypothetical protein HKO95_01670 [Rhodobacteraceae bacterium]|nr:hypothetical protein [Paracoccaceae bacterium]NNK65425.1 hypothetical protein [Paracoccaceae bacterium]